MPSPSSEDQPVIKSRTGKFLQGVLGKVQGQSEAPDPPNSSNPTPSEFLQPVPELTDWDDDDEESNWDDDFVEAPAPFPVQSNTPEPPVVTPPPPPPAPPQELSSTETPPTDPPSFPSSITPPTAPPAPPSFSQIAAETPLPVASEPAPPPTETGETKGPIAVNIPRPKNIKYKNKPGDGSPEPREQLQPTVRPTASAESRSAMIDADSGTIELNIKRPTNIKYKAKPPAPTSVVDKLLAPLRALIGKFQLPSLSLPSFSLPALPFPNLAEDRRKIITIAAAVFLALTAAWATINFWPGSSTVAAKSPSSSVLDGKPVPNNLTANPETELVTALQSKLQALASQYPAGLIGDLELTAEQQLATVMVSDRWFSMSLTERQQIAQSLWQQAVSYGMAKLEVRSKADQLLARSPIVGGMAILVDGF